MHDTALEIGSKFLELYASEGAPLILELGSFDVNGSLRSGKPPNATYLGLDVEHGPGVDIVVAPRQPLPIRDDFADIVVTTSQMEHDVCFWQTILELFRILKPGGTLYFSAPSNGVYHSYPVDVWRFYPDAALALVEWAVRNGMAVSLVESFTAERASDMWNDYVCVFRKGDAAPDEGTTFLSDLFPATNVRTFKSAEVQRREAKTEDMRLIEALRMDVTGLRATLAAAEARLRELERDRAAGVPTSASAPSHSGPSDQQPPTQRSPKPRKRAARRADRPSKPPATIGG